MREHFEQFRSAIHGTGLIPPEAIEADGKLHRFASNGQPGDDAGWYVLHGDGIPAGAFGDWRSGLSETWRADVGRSLSPQEEAAHRARVDAIRRERETEEAERKDEAAESAREIWQSAGPAPADHAYLLRKGVKAHDIRMYAGVLAICGMDCDGALVIPVRDVSGQLHSVEFVAADGEKRYLTGGRVKGCYFDIGKPGDVLVIAEGFATAASIHEAAGCATACAFHAGNLEPVAIELRRKFPAVRLILAADNDVRDGANVGVSKAREAARAVSALVAVPELEGGKCDFNDLFLARGADAVRAALDAAEGPPEPEAADSSYVAARIIELAKLSRVDYDRVRKDEAKALRLQLRTLDAEVAKARDETTSEAGLIFEDPEPWPADVNGAELLQAMCDEIERYLVLPTRASSAVALWALHTWCLDAFSITPFLYPRSPEKRCGKTTLMLVVHELVRRPLLATNASPAALFRCIEECRPTLLLDEADTWLRENEELRGILNGGHSRKTARVIRTVGDDHTVRAFSTFCPKAIAGIGRLADTLEDRSIVIPMKRKRAEDHTAPLREDRLNLLDIRRRCLRWAEDHIEGLRAADPETPPALHDRAADNWRALLAIADAAGGDWPREARAAALALAGQADDEAIGTQLLTDIHALFDRQVEDFGRPGGDCGGPIASAALVESLGAMEDRPWADWRQGKPITAPQVARLLKAFDIRPRTVRIGTQTAKGYLREQFADTFARYLPANSQAVTPSHSHEFGRESVTLSRHSGSEATRHIVTTDAVCDGVSDTQKRNVTAGDGQETYENRLCDGVTARSAGAADAQNLPGDREAF